MKKTKIYSHLPNICAFQKKTLYNTSCLKNSTALFSKKIFFYNTKIGNNDFLGQY